MGLSKDGATGRVTILLDVLHKIAYQPMPATLDADGRMMSDWAAEALVAYEESSDA